LGDLLVGEALPVMFHGLHETDQVVRRSPPFESSSARRAQMIGGTWANYKAPKFAMP